MRLPALTTQLSGGLAGDAAGACMGESCVGESCNAAADDELAALRSRVAQLESERDPRVLGGISAQLSAIHRTLQDRTAELEGMRMRNMELNARLRAAEG